MKILTPFILFALLSITCSCGSKDHATQSMTTSESQTTDPLITASEASQTTDTSVASSEPTVTEAPTSTAPLGSTGTPSETGTGTLDCSSEGGATLSPCTTWDDSCPECYKCMPYGEGGTWNKLGCFVMSLDSRRVGEQCQSVQDEHSGISIDNCERGLFCLDEVCVPFCEGANFSCPEIYVCVDGGPVYKVCYVRCDPLAPNCSEGDVCVQNGGYGYFLCVGTLDNKPAFDDCVYSEECAPGSGCFSHSVATECEGTNSCCNNLCDLENPQCPGEGQACVPYFEMPQFLEYQRLGYCTI